MKKKQKNENENEKEKKKEKSKLKIHKRLLGINRGYPSQKPIKGGLGKGRKP